MGAPHAQTSVRRLFLALVAAFLLASLGLTPDARAAPSGPASGRSLAVSVPPEPTVVRPGSAAKIPIRVLNPGHSLVTATITAREVRLLDDGVVRVGTGPDPAWQGRVSFTPSIGKQWISRLIALQPGA